MESLFQIAYRPGTLQLRLMENMLKMSSPTYILHSHSAAKVYTDFPFKVNLYSLSEHFPCIWIDCSYLLWLIVNTAGIVANWYPGAFREAYYVDLKKEKTRGFFWMFFW